MVGEGDVRAMVRLLGDISVMRDDIAAKKRHLMTGLAEMVGADAWNAATTLDEMRALVDDALARADIA